MLKKTYHKISRKCMCYCFVRLCKTKHMGSLWITLYCNHNRDFLRNGSFSSTQVLKNLFGSEHVHIFERVIQFLQICSFRHICWNTPEVSRAFEENYATIKTKTSHRSYFSLTIVFTALQTVV